MKSKRDIAKASSARKARILDQYAKGELVKVIAADEGVIASYVSRVASAAGQRRRKVRRDASLTPPKRGIRKL